MITSRDIYSILFNCSLFAVQTNTVYIKDSYTFLSNFDSWKNKISNCSAMKKYHLP